MIRFRPPCNLGSNPSSSSLFACHLLCHIRPRLVRQSPCILFCSSALPTLLREQPAGPPLSPPLSPASPSLLLLHTPRSCQNAPLSAGFGHWSRSVYTRPTTPLPRDRCAYRPTRIREAGRSRLVQAATRGSARSLRQQAELAESRKGAGAAAGARHLHSRAFISRHAQVGATSRQSSSTDAADARYRTCGIMAIRRTSASARTTTWRRMSRPSLSRRRSWTIASLWDTQCAYATAFKRAATLTSAFQGRQGCHGAGVGRLRCPLSPCRCVTPVPPPLNEGCADETNLQLLTSHLRSARSRPNSRRT